MVSINAIWVEFEYEPLVSLLDDTENGRKGIKFWKEKNTF